MPSPIFDAPLTSTLVPTLAGNPAFTFTRATTAYVADNENILRQATTGEARFTGARRVRNWIVGSSENLNNAAWAVTTMTRTPGVTDPLGGTSAFTLTATGASANCYNQMSALFLSSSSLVNSAWIRRRTGTGQIVFRNPNNVDVDITSQLTTSWKRFAASSVPAGTSAFLLFGITVSGDAIDIAWAQTEIVDGQSNQAPSEYVSVGVLAAPYHGNGVDGVKYFPTLNANSVAGNIVTEAQGTLIPTATLLGYVAENAATNLCLQSQDFTTSYNGLNVVRTANTQVAPDGTLTADTFADNTTSGIHSLSQPNFSIANATATTFSLYVKQGTLPWIQLLFFDGVSKWANFNLATGAVGNKHASVTATSVALPNGWYRISMSFTMGAASDQLQIISSLTDAAAAQPSYVGTGQTMYLWGAQVETGSDPSSYIPTVAVSVTRNGDDLQYPVPSNVDGALGSSYAETYFSTPSLLQKDVLKFNSFSLYPQVYLTPKLALYSVGGIPTANDRLVGAINKGATGWGGVTGSSCLNGGAVATGAFTSVTTAGTFRVGSSVGPTNYLQGSIRNVKFYNVRLTDAQLIQLTTDGFLPPDVVPVDTSAQGGIGARVRRYRRIEVEIDGEIFPVASEEEGRELLLKAREAAKQAAQAAAVRAAAKAEKKTSPAAVERALALSTPRISLRADDRSEALAQAIQAQVDAAQAAIDEDYATARRMAYAYVRQRLQDEQRQRELAADEEEVIAMILRLP